MKVILIINNNAAYIYFQWSNYHYPCLPIPRTRNCKPVFFFGSDMLHIFFSTLRRYIKTYVCNISRTIFNLNIVRNYLLLYSILGHVTFIRD